MLSLLCFHSADSREVHSKPQHRNNRQPKPKLNQKVSNFNLIVFLIQISDYCIFLYIVNWAYIVSSEYYKWYSMYLVVGIP